MINKTIHSVLKEKWGYDNFRPKQESIINSVLGGNDTIALLPTGGGKSICYQVPGIYKGGITIVISPLIALMKDQVESLVSRGINAIALTSELNEKETDIELDNCVNGDVDFLYISPEKLKNKLLKYRLPLMNVSLIAVDEAHCISQWGHDFRPSYLDIFNIRNIIPNVPLLALTATATKPVLKDISKYLELRKENTFQTSFERDNVSFWVLKEEDKFFRLNKILAKIFGKPNSQDSFSNKGGSAIVYVRNRRKTKEISDVINKFGFSATFYHAGVDKLDKTKRQQQWMNNKIKVIVATNAFGMGIDKPDVRLVVHMDLPDSPEAYFQEAGRGGRDGNKSYAISIFNQSDIDNLRSFHIKNLSDKYQVKNVLKLLYKEFKIAINTANFTKYSFNLTQFVHQNSLNFYVTYNAITILNKEGVISLSSSNDLESKIWFKVSTLYLFSYKDNNEYLNSFIDAILRNYGGVTDDYIKVNEYNFGKRNKISTDSVRKNFMKLHKDGIISYIPSSKGQQITFLEPRNVKSTIGRIAKSIEIRNLRIVDRVESMIAYAKNNSDCRNHQMLDYFGQDKGKECGFCDVCISKKKAITYSVEIENSILETIGKRAHSSRELALKFNYDENLIISALVLLLEKQKIFVNDESRYVLVEK